MQTMMYILSSRCASCLTMTRSDNSGLGVAGYIKLTTAAATYYVYHAYVPPPPATIDGPATLNVRLRRYLASQQRNLSPQQYVLSQLTACITNARRTDVAIIVGGDFNMDPAQPRGTPLHQWAQAVDHLHHPTVLNTHLWEAFLARDLIMSTWMRRLLHCCALRMSCMNQQPWRYLIIVLSMLPFRCTGPPHQPPPPPPPRLEPPHHNSQLVERFQQRMLHWTQQYSPACSSAGSCNYTRCTYGRHYNTCRARHAAQTTASTTHRTSLAIQGRLFPDLLCSTASSPASSCSAA